MRQMATLRRIDAIQPIPNADAIECVVVGGWKVVAKKGEYQPGDLAVYCEIDSWIPNDLAPFLSKKEPKEFNGVKGERLRTVRLRGQLSQGLLLPLTVLKNDGAWIAGVTVDDGTDVSDVLGIQKWEAPIPAQLAGQVRGNFPSAIPKTDQERVQNINLNEYLEDTYEVTEKLHGASCTFYLDKEGDFHVCSRNLDLKPDPNNAYWKAAYKLDIEAKMRKANLFGYAIQGELCGEGINGNNYQLGLEFFAFDVYQVGIGYWRPTARQRLIEMLGIRHVPVLTTMTMMHSTKEEILAGAEGTSAIAPCKREGLVYKSEHSDKTFKAVSNAWLLKYE